MKYLSSFIFLHIVILSIAQNTDRYFVSSEKVEDGQRIEVNDGFYLIKFYDKNIVETSFVPNDEKFEPNSHAVVKSLDAVATSYEEDNNEIDIKSRNLRVHIKKKPFQISYYYKDQYLISEKRGYVKDSLDNLEFNLSKDEILYGGGARALGMNRRGHKLQLYNRAHYGYETHSELMNYTMPIVISSKKYLLHFDNAPIGFLDLDSKGDNTLNYQTISGRKTYQIVVGEDWKSLVSHYTSLTGRQPMLPRWALGNFASRFGYHSQEEVLATAKAFDDKNVPLDAIILDLYWFGKEIKGTMGNLTFNKDSFPEPKKMIQELRNQNIETVLITEPFILTTSKKWDEAVAKDVLAKDSLGLPYTYDFYFGNTGLIDIYSPKGYKWFKQIYGELFDYGVTGIWGDLGEPEVHPKGLLHAIGTADEVHNIYGHDWARLVQDAFKTHLPKVRPFILMRAGYSGTQQYGIVPWSGDVNRSWGGLQSQPEIALQMGMQGLGYMHSDLGGFAGDLEDDELYIRWLQYGVFQPIFRPHAQESVPSEPVFKDKATLDLARKAINLRYRMLPYNYHLMFVNTQLGLPLMRPVFFEEPNSLEFLETSDTYLWGDNFLISPVLEKGQTAKSIHFPNSSDWIDFYTHHKYKGGSIAELELTQNYIPTFVRSGSLIPLSPPIQSTKVYNGDELELHYFFDAEESQSSTQLYNDDGITPDAYSKGKYELMHFEVDNTEPMIKLILGAELGKQYPASNKKITWVIHGLTKTPKDVYIEGRRYKVNWKSYSKTLKIETQWNPTEPKTITLHLKQ